MTSIPANATEAPSVAKAWQQLKHNASSFTVIWGSIFIAHAIENVFSWLLSEFLYPVVYQAVENTGFDVEVDLEHFDSVAEAVAQYIIGISSLPMIIIVSFTSVLITAIAAVYYTTDHCPRPDKIFNVLSRRPLRYLLAGLLFNTILGIGLLYFIVPAILVALVRPIYVHYVFTTDLDLTTCLSKAFKGMFQNFCPFFVISLLCFLSILASVIPCILPVLVIYPMAELYMQNYIHHKGMVSTRSTPNVA